MSDKITEGRRLRARRKKRVRAKISGTGERPRLSLFRSSRHVYAQVIDDLRGHTLVSISSYRKGEKSNANITVCENLGKQLAEKCLTKDISSVVFDKNGNLFHGRVKAFADGARAGGLEF